MAKFSNFFGSKPRRKDWGVVTSNIAGALEEEREYWFKSCVQNFRDLQASEDGAAIDIEVRNPNITGAAELAIKAYQLFLVLGFLSQHAYIRRRDGNDFADLLFPEVCGTQLEECRAYFSRYYEARRDGATQMMRFSNDVARHISGKEGPLVEGMMVAASMAVFVAMNHIAVARCFGDEKTVRKIEAKMGKMAG